MKSLHALLLSAALAVAATPVLASEAIIKKARCVACHSIDKKLVGPAYKDVAAKYRDVPDAVPQLMAKVRKGGAGVWGEVPMIPHPEDKISDADLKAAIEWILTLK